MIDLPPHTDEGTELATIEVKLRPFTVPNYVLCEVSAKPKQEGMQELPKYALHELDDNDGKQ